MIMNPNFRHTITLFNCVREKGKETWYKTVLSGCFFTYSTTITDSNGQIMRDNTHTVRIPYSEHYLDYSAFTNMETKTGYFTLRRGDVIVLGAVDDKIDGTQGKRASDIIEKYEPKAFKVRTIADNSLSPYSKHLRVTD